MSYARNYVLQLPFFADHAGLDQDQLLHAIQFMMNEFFQSTCRMNWIRLGPKTVHHRKRSAFLAYLFQSGSSSQSCAEALRCGFAEEDHSVVARYEEEVQTAQRVRNAAITERIIMLGLNIAKAWARSNRAATQ